MQKKWQSKISLKVENLIADELVIYLAELLLLSFVVSLTLAFYFLFSTNWMLTFSFIQPLPLRPYAHSSYTS
jgi:hypothetical protein